ncbi:MAG: capsular biosynthesis protein [Gammaproteobacteria bacterium]|nr:capsular biosynthesis protein [Gammaproteobacteria bacterium]
MIDLHAHILPKLVDGSSENTQVSEQLVRTAMEDGIHTIVCTPRMGADRGLSAATIRKRFFRFYHAVQELGYPISLKLGADIDLSEGLAENLRSAKFLTINRSRYFLLRLPKEAPSLMLEGEVEQCLAAGYIPILTHPERLNWISSHYKRVVNLLLAGAWLHITGDSLTGHLGRLPKYWAERLLDEGLVHLIATDAHARDKRAPMLSEAFELASVRVGSQEATQLVEGRPKAVLFDMDPQDVILPPALIKEKPLPVKLVSQGV